jgi:hypothetical protein
MHAPFAWIIPEKYSFAVALFVYIILIVVYAFIVWKLYKFFAKKNIFHLNLSKYSTSRHPRTKKFFAFLLYLAEYFLVLPLLTFFWFALLALMLLLLSNGQPVSQILIIAAAIVGATRLASYISNDLSMELSKLFPLTFLAVFLSNPNFFSLPTLALRFVEVPLFLNEAIIYIVIIFMMEGIIRIIYEIVSRIRNSGRERDAQQKKERTLNI